MDIGEAVKNWTGRTSQREDVIDERLIAEYQATLAPFISRACAVPPGIHWCLGPDIVTPDLLGRDCHPRLGLFLPDVALPRRMWAGGEIEGAGDFEPGDCVTRRSTIESIAPKAGKSGRLCFVTVRHDYSSRGQVRLRERQDIVYREDPPPGPPAGALGPMVAPPAGSWTVEATPTLLFRYSAMTFNGHRIHYDHPYATSVEGYAGLVVHGPLQATLMLNRVATGMRGFPRRFPIALAVGFQQVVHPVRIEEAVVVRRQ